MHSSTVSTAPDSLVDAPAAHPASSVLSQALSSLLTAPGPGAAPVLRSAPGLQAQRLPITPRAFTCRCGRPVFFRNSECLACHTPLGYAAEIGLLLPLEPDTGSAEPSVEHWREVDSPPDAPRYRRCANLKTQAACNWLIGDDDAYAGEPPLCRCCRLTRTLPDLSLNENGVWWSRIELAKRRVVSSLIGLKLPVPSRAEEPVGGLVFDLLRAAPGGPPVVTGHVDGVITIDVAEADDARREQQRQRLGEPYRTLLGHLRHESGHYYWQRLVERSDWLEPWRVLFGDERADYNAALQQHYAGGARADWGQQFVSAYASSHPWEDWAETWAHYLHMVDTLDTARSFGLDGESVELSYERFGPEVLAVPDDPQAEEFLQLIHSWMELTGVLNELSRSMGMSDFYSFVLSRAVVQKLHLVHRIVAAAAAGPAA